MDSYKGDGSRWGVEDAGNGWGYLTKSGKRCSNGPVLKSAAERDRETNAKLDRDGKGIK